MTAALFSVTLDDLDATTRLGATLADVLKTGDVVYLDGPLGAGKTALARAILHAKMRREGRMEDVPSPSFTLIQHYEFDGGDVWHTDLYRLNDVAEVEELGLFDAMETSICLIEWPDRLGDAGPRDVLKISFDVDPAADARILRFAGGEGWRGRLEPVFGEAVNA